MSIVFKWKMSMNSLVYMTIIRKETSIVILLMRLIFYLLIKKILKSNTSLVIDLSNNSYVSFYKLCRNTICALIIDKSIEFIHRQYIFAADIIYISNMELKYTFPLRLHHKIIIKNYELINDKKRHN